jgi:hypothetical protein
VEASVKGVDVVEESSISSLSPPSGKSLGKSLNLNLIWRDWNFSSDVIEQFPNGLVAHKHNLLVGVFNPLVQFHDQFEGLGEDDWARTIGQERNRRRVNIRAQELNL